jgi:Kef-type K+ transport system membrane component KefB
MRKVLLFSVLLMLGLLGSQTLPNWFEHQWHFASETIHLLTLIALAFIMIHVGYEFEIDKRKLKSYAFDYWVAMTAAAFPWIFAALYFTFAMLHPSAWSNFSAWKETLLIARFASPTSAGVLFSMMAAAGLSATWVFRKARVLAIFDDLDSVLLMIPLKMLIVGPQWQLLVTVFIMFGLVWLAWQFLHRWQIPITWQWVFGYAVLTVLLTEGVGLLTGLIDANAPIHVEVLLPAFALGCMMARPKGANPHRNDALEGHQEGPESAIEQQVSTIVSAVFMVLVGLSMPLISHSHALAQTINHLGVTASQPDLPYTTILLHVIALTVLINLGKMFPAFVYQREASLRERIALAVGMWPRGEVGAGILVISLGFGMGGAVVTVGVLSLALNLLLTGVFILIVKNLIQPSNQTQTEFSSAFAPAPFGD